MSTNTTTGDPTCWNNPNLSGTWATATGTIVYDSFTSDTSSTSNITWTTGSADTSDYITLPSVTCDNVTWTITSTPYWVVDPVAEEVVPKKKRKYNRTIKLPRVILLQQRILVWEL